MVSSRASEWALAQPLVGRLQATTGIADALGVRVPDDAQKIGFKLRLAAYRSLVEQLPDPAAREYHGKLIQRISNANGQRQTLVHGVWDYDAADPDFLIVENAGTGAKPRIVDVDKVVGFIHEVGRLALNILYPNGIGLEHLADRGPYMSRDFLRAITDKKR